MTQTELILNLLKANGRVSNFELNDIAFRYGARICELRRAGHQIETVHDPEIPSKWWFVYRGGGESVDLGSKIQPTPQRIEKSGIGKEFIERSFKDDLFPPILSDSFTGAIL